MSDVLMVKRYLGDSVYAEVEDGMVLLTTDNGFGPRDRIYLEPETASNLVDYLQEIFNVQKDHS